MPFAAPKTTDRRRETVKLAMPRHLKSEIVLQRDDRAHLYAALNADLHQVEALTKNVRVLVQDCDSLLDAEGLRYQIETLERCVDYYRRGIAAARIMGAFGHDWLEDMQMRLKQAVDEQHRYDGEGASNYSSLKGREGVEEAADRMANALHHAGAAQTIVNDMFMRHPASADASQQPH